MSATGGPPATAASTRGRDAQDKRALLAQSTCVDPLLVPTNGLAALDRARPHRASRLRFWSPHSPNFRFFILGLATLVPFGGHVIKYSISSLQKEMLADPEFGLTHTRLGMFQSAVSIPNLFMPLLGGLLLDHKGSAIGTMASLALCLVGHLGFVIACSYRSFQWALLSRVVFGLGQGSTVVAQGRICATWFVGREIVFAIALTESTHNLSNWIAFIYVVPVSEYMGGYIYALWFGLAFCVLSFLAGLWFFAVNKDAAPSMHQIKHSRAQQEQLTGSGAEEADAEVEEAPNSPYRRSESELGREEDALIRGNSPVSAYSSFGATTTTSVHDRLVVPNNGEDEEVATCPSPLDSPASSVLSSISDSDDVPSSYDVQPSRRPWNPLAGLSIGFAILCVLHMVYSNCFHLFAYISAAFIADRFSTSLAEAGWLAGLSNGLAIFLCPLAGIAMDYVGYKMWIQVIAGIVTTTAYLLLLASAVSPVPSLVLLAICVSFTPTILKSSVPNLVLPAVYGSAYGIYEIMESVGSVVGNMAVGFFRDSTHSWDLDLAVFAGMGATATALTVLLIFMDFMGWIGLGAGAPVGALNQSSFQTKLQQDQLKKRKDRFLQKESRWKVIEQQQREEMEHEAQILHVEDGHVFTPTNKEAMAAAAGVATACSRV